MSESRDSEVLPGLPRHAGARWTLGAVPQGLRTLPGDSDVRCGPSSQHRAHPTRHPGPECLPSGGTESLSVPFLLFQFPQFAFILWGCSAGKDLEELDSRLTLRAVRRPLAWGRVMGTSV